MWALLLGFTLGVLPAWGQYGPPAGQSGSIAVHKSDPSIRDWADSVLIQRGWQDIQNQSKGKASAGAPGNALGTADGSIVSLGDGGMATYVLEEALLNVPGYDFAVFENAFLEDFLELGYVALSVDGQDFVRFPAHSLTDTSQNIGAFGLLDTRKINNLAGRFKVNYGTPFDLEELKDSMAIDSIHYIRIVDVVGTKDPSYATKDTAGRAIIDPYPTAFASSGFDLDALALLSKATSVGKQQAAGSIAKSLLYPQPAARGSFVQSSIPFKALQIYGPTGQQQYQRQWGRTQRRFKLPELNPGIYIVQLQTEQGWVTQKLAIKN